MKVISKLSFSYLCSQCLTAKAKGEGWYFSVRSHRSTVHRSQPTDHSPQFTVHSSEIL